MQGRIPWKEYLPAAPMLIEYRSFHCKAYSRQVDFVFGVETAGAPYREVDQFKDDELSVSTLEGLYSNVRKMGGSLENETADAVRLAFFLDTVQQEGRVPVSRLENGQRMLIDFLAAGEQLYLLSRDKAKTGAPMVPRVVPCVVLQLCAKYGLLQTQGEQQEIPKSLTLPGTPADYKKRSLYYGFSLVLASRKLIELYALMLCWKALVWHEDETTSRRLKSILYLSRHEPCDLRNYTTEDYQLFVRKQAIVNSPNRQIDFGPDGCPYTVNNYDSALAAAFGLMLQIIGMGEASLEDRRSAICERCGAEYIKHHGRQKFCPVCAQPKVRVREHRAKQKAKEAQHEKKGKQ